MAKNILTARIHLKGSRPLLWHRFGAEALSGDRKERTGTAGNDSEEWRHTVLVTPEGQLYLEPTYAFATLREAARYTKKGRSSLQASLAATLQVLDEQIPVNRWWPGFPGGQLFSLKEATPPAEDPTQPIYLDIRGVVNPSTRARNVRYRIAAAPGWECQVTVRWDVSVVSREQLQAIAQDAGQLVGIGNGRAIGFGRFEVTQCEFQAD